MSSRNLGLILFIHLFFVQCLPINMTTNKTHHVNSPDVVIRAHFYLQLQAFVRISVLFTLVAAPEEQVEPVGLSQS